MYARGHLDPTLGWSDSKQLQTQTDSSNGPRTDPRVDHQMAGEEESKELEWMMIITAQWLDEPPPGLLLN